MNALNSHMMEYQAQLKKGSIQKAYRGLMQYIRDLRNWHCEQYPDYSVPTNIYCGNMDITFFAVVPPSLKSRKLKLLIAFNHEDFQFELWLAGVNRGVQSKYLSLLREHGWNNHPLAPADKSVDYISKSILDIPHNFDDLETLTKEIDQATQDFISELKRFLKKYD